MIGKEKISAAVLATLLLTTFASTGAMANSDSRLEQDRQEAQQMKDQLNSLDQQHRDALAQIQKVEAEISQGMQKSNQLQTEIAALETKIAEQKQQLKGRVKVMYEGGDVSFWEVLFESTTFSDFIERFSLLSMILDQDKKLVDELTANQRKVKASQEALEAEQASRKAKQQELMKLEATMSDQYKNLKVQLSEKEQEIANAEAEALQTVATYQAEQAGQTPYDPQVPQVIASGGSGMFAWPVPSTHTVSSYFGPRWGTMHNGIDVPAPVGTPMVSIADGTVVAAGPASGYGHWVVIDHGGGISSVYGHMYADGIYVSVGQHVQKGQVIAGIGNDGFSTGAHLHFGLTVNGAWVNPMGYL